MENQKKLNSTNKLIAEFMGYKEGGPGFLAGYFIFNDFIQYHELKFHKSWNWLMICLSKIDELEYELPEDSNLIGDISCALLNIDIESTYDAVVKFIKFYNKNT